MDVQTTWAHSSSNIPTHSTTKPSGSGAAVHPEISSQGIIDERQRMLNNSKLKPATKKIMSKLNCSLASANCLAQLQSIYLIMFNLNVRLKSELWLGHRLPTSIAEKSLSFCYGKGCSEYIISHILSMVFILLYPLLEKECRAGSWRIRTLLLHHSILDCILIMFRALLRSWQKKEL